MEETTKLLQQVVCLLAVILIPAAVILGLIGRFLTSSGFRGKIGERGVARALHRSLPEEDYTILHDVLLPLPPHIGEGTTQLDHLVVSPFGVFCVETKNMSGAIYGREREKSWTQKIGRQTHRFQNPLRQNYLHTSTVSSLLGVPAEQTHSVVVFTGTAQLKTPMPPNVVLSRKACTQYIRTFDHPVFQPNQVESIMVALSNYHLGPAHECREEHVAALRRRHSPGGKTGP